MFSFFGSGLEAQRPCPGYDYDNLMSAINNIQRQITINQRRLQFLKEQQARLGVHTLPHILMDIEDTEAAIAELEVDLAELRVKSKKVDETPATDTQMQRVQIHLQGEFSTVTPEIKSAAIAAFAAVMGISPKTVELYSLTPGSIVFHLGLPSAGVQRLRTRLQANSAQLRLLKVERVSLEWLLGGFEEWVFRDGRFDVVSSGIPPAPPQALPPEVPVSLPSVASTQGISITNLLLITGIMVGTAILVVGGVIIWQIWPSPPEPPTPLPTTLPEPTDTPTSIPIKPTSIKDNTPTPKTVLPPTTTPPAPPSPTIPTDIDSDQDRLKDSEEEQLGTDPFNPDTDSDGLWDGDEVTIGTDPHNLDSDNDRLWDGHELDFETDPLNPDSDGDGLPDGDEVTIGTDPHNLDSDNDGLWDGHELDFGTDPLNPDSDGEGLLDGYEVGIGTNPTKFDSDDEGLPDDQEVERGTDPNNQDTDNDGLSDYEEVLEGTDPTDPLDPYSN